MTDLELILKEIERFAAAYQAGDLPALMSVYTDDLIKARHGSPSELRSATQDRIGAVMRDFNGHLNVTNEEIVVAGDFAYVRGFFEVLLTRKKEGHSRTIRRRFLEIWRKDNGQWRVARTMDNMDSPEMEGRPG